MSINVPKVLQLIDSLNIGGAERVSVNLANALSQMGVESYLCATRTSGSLEKTINHNVTKLLLNKKSALDIKAMYSLIKFIRQNKINIIHAHSSSFFMAVLCKLFTQVRVVWHDHNGVRPNENKKFNSIIILFSYFFDVVIVVNEILAQWSREKLHISPEKVYYLQNFAQLDLTYNTLNLPGDVEKRIVHLANLRWQKDHMTLLKAFFNIYNRHKDWHLLLVGQDRKDLYSKKVKTYIIDNGLEKNVHLLGVRDDIGDILLNSTIGVISSVSEGLPIALLEYGLAKLPVVCTDVGQCADVLGQGEFGKVIPTNEIDIFTNELLLLMEDKKEQARLATAFHTHIELKYSQDVVMRAIVTIYKEVLNV